MDPYRDAGDVPAYLSWTHDVLEPYGFHSASTLPLVSVCRDELMFSFVDAVTARWGHAFDLSSLAGLPLLGRTGVAAALGHAPDERGHHRLVVLAFPHIGVDADGCVGVVHRPGVPGTTAACGAVAVAASALADGVSGVVLDRHDIEESLLVGRLRRVLGDAPVPALPDLTELVRRAAVDELALLLDTLSTDTTPVDYALLSGVVVHRPDVDVVAPASASLKVDGVRRDLGDR